MKFDLAELSGSLGDLGTFIPIAVSMIGVCGLDAGTVFFFAGLFNVITGLVFNQPVPVQPMKAIAAVAITECLAPGEIAAAGFAAGIMVLALGLSGLVTWVERAIPRPVVRGIQLGVGLKLAVTGLGMVTATGWWGLDSRVVALACAILVLVASMRSRRFPSALALLIASLAIIFAGHPGILEGASFGWAGPALLLPSWAHWKAGILRGALPQLPLTLLNSVIAVCALSEDLFPGRGVRSRSMAISVGLMNGCGCLLGAMPACHGSGGLAGQYRFGARTGGSVVALGIAKMAVGVLLGAAAMPVLKAFPASVLGMLLFFAGAELALPARDCADRDPFLVVVVTAAGILAVNTMTGCLLGLAAGTLLLRKHR